MALITLLRHAPLPLEYQKRYVGHSDINIDLSLTDISKLDRIKNRKYDYIYSSDLKRCMQTLDLINLKYIKDFRLREVKFKDEFECKNFAEIENSSSYDVNYLSSSRKWHEFVCSESFLDFEYRIKDFLNALPKNGNVLICSHAGTIKMIYSILKKLDYETSLFKIDYIESLDLYYK